MRVAVTGISGQVVSSLVERGGASDHDVIAVGRPELDLTDGSTVLKSLQAYRPDVIVSAAAYTAVDKAEQEAELVQKINGAGAGLVAEAAASLSVPLIHLSTDYVFDGMLSRPYVEGDPVAPIGAYGLSKLAGEEAVLAAHDDSAILRVAWVYSPFGTNFVKTMLRLAGERDEISVVADQYGNPTSALAIADGILTVATNLLSESSARLRGIFHMTAAGDASWADFAEAIFLESAARGGPSATVRRIGSADYPTLARRPSNSRLDCTRLATMHGVALPAWQSSLSDVVDRLVPAAH